MEIVIARDNLTTVTELHQVYEGSILYSSIFGPFHEFEFAIAIFKFRKTEIKDKKRPRLERPFVDSANAASR